MVEAHHAALKAFSAREDVAAMLVEGVPRAFCAGAGALQLHYMLITCFGATWVIPMVLHYQPAVLIIRQHKQIQHPRLALFSVQSRCIADLCSGDRWRHKKHQRVCLAATLQYGAPSRPPCCPGMAICATKAALNNFLSPKISAPRGCCCQHFSARFKAVGLSEGCRLPSQLRGK
jgi:hypothetical protein